jgi:glycosyltransferase involved in cell wall biosynthesis
MSRCTYGERNNLLMQVWLINIAEHSPVDGEKSRLRRMGILADRLVDRGHGVLWWTSTFDHSHKRQRFHEDRKVELCSNHHLWFMHAPAYRGNVSLRRLWNHHLLGRKFAHLATKEPVPDLILCSLPTLEMGVSAAAYGARAGVPVVLDIRDLWPDVMLDLFPGWTRAVGSLAVLPLERMASRACRGAFAITGTTPGFVRWGLDRAGRPAGDWDRDFPFGYPAKKLDPAARAKALEFWAGHGVRPEGREGRICFFGAVGRQFAFDTLFQAIRMLRGRLPAQLVLCGVGDRLEDCRRAAADLPEIVFPGWVGPEEIWALMEISSFAVAPYQNKPNFTKNITNKLIEYLAGGLPVLTSLREGVLPELLAANDCGMSYGDDPRKLAEILCSLQVDPSRRRTMGSHALDLFQSRFEASKVYEGMIDYLEGVAQAHQNGRSRAS